MKNLFEPATIAEVKQRVAQLKPDSQRQWGTMNVAQAVAHCAASLEWAVGDTLPPRMFIGQIIGRIVKPMVLRDNKPMRRNSPTAQTLIVADQRDLRAEQQRLSHLFSQSSLQAHCPTVRAKRLKLQEPLRTYAQGATGCICAGSANFEGLSCVSWRVWTLEQQSVRVSIFDRSALCYIPSAVHLAWFLGF